MRNPFNIWYSFRSGVFSSCDTHYAKIDGVGLFIPTSTRTHWTQNLFELEASKRLSSRWVNSQRRAARLVWLSICFAVNISGKYIFHFFISNLIFTAGASPFPILLLSTRFVQYALFWISRMVRGQNLEGAWVEDRRWIYPIVKLQYYNVQESGLGVQLRLTKSTDTNKDKRLGITSNFIQIISQNPRWEEEAS